jgi:tetratricopeptide (TPR) repeat protein
MNIGVVHAQQVCQHLENDPPVLERCLKALGDSQKGQFALQRGESRRALDHLRRAEADFDAIPAATFLLGIARADIAAAYANLEQWPNAARYARQAIEIARHDKAFAETEANAHMTLANALGALGDLEAARMSMTSLKASTKR